MSLTDWDRAGDGLVIAVSRLGMCVAGSGIDGDGLVIDVSGLVDRPTRTSDAWPSILRASTLRLLVRGARTRARNAPARDRKRPGHASRTAPRESGLMALPRAGLQASSRPVPTRGDRPICAYAGDAGANDLGSINVLQCMCLCEPAQPRRHRSHPAAEQKQARWFRRRGRGKDRIAVEVEQLTRRDVRL